MLRGVGFRSGTYIDIPDISPLTGAATTEVRGVHPFFLSDILFPVRPWRVNYFDALVDPANGRTLLNITPAQYVSDGPESPTGVLRQWDEIGFRLYYSENLTTFAGGSTPSTSAPPAITNVGASSSADSIDFSISVVGDPAAGVQETWITYTLCDGSACSGIWQSLDLTRNPDDTTQWIGTLPLNSSPASHIRYVVQAANGVGLIALNTNQGTYFIPDIDPGNPSGSGDPSVSPEPTDLVFVTPAASGPYATQQTFTALLNDESGPVGGQRITFALGSQQRSAHTNSDGLASVEMPLLGYPGADNVRISFAGNPMLAASEASVAFTIVKQATQITLPPPH